MRAGLREWLSDAQSAFRRSPAEAPQAPGYTPIASGRGRSRSPDRGAQRVPPPPPPPPATPAALPSDRGRSRSMDRGRTKAVADAAKRAVKSAEIHAAPEPTKPRRGERSRSPTRAGASADAVVAAVKQRVVPARVTKPKPIAAPRPSKRYGPNVGLGKASAPPNDPPPPTRKKIVKIAKSKFAMFVKPRAPAPAPAPAPEEAVQREPEKKHIVKTAAAFIKKKSTKPATVKPAAAKVPKAAPDPQDMGAPEPAAKRRKQVPTKSKKSHRPFAIAAM